MRIGTIALALALAGCSNAVQDAEWAFYNSTGAGGKCSAAIKAADAYAAQRDEQNYRLWQAHASLACT